MSRRTIISLVTVLVLAAPGLACGPNCHQITAKKAPEELSYADAQRVNGLVERRKAAMEAAKEGGAYVIQDAKQTVTACEMAIKFQVQIINLQEAGSPLVEEHSKKINEARCFLDDVLESKGKLIGAGKGAFISGSDIRTIREYLDTFKTAFRGEGAASERRLVTIYEDGLKAKAPSGEGAAGEGGQAAEEAPAGDDGETAAEEDAEWDTPAADEEGDVDNSGSMDAF